MKDPPADRIGVLPEAPVPAVAGSAGEGEILLASNGRAGANEDLIREALKQRGKPYVWGGASRGGFDCSGFVCYIFRKMRGMNLPHSAAAQSRLGTHVPRSELQPGDVVFFSTYRAGISHVGIYLGDNRFIHAANTRRDVRIDTLTGYYDKRYRTARRLAPTPLRLEQKEIERLMNGSSELPSENRSQVPGKKTE